MKEETKIELMNTFRNCLGIIAVFFAGYWLKEQFAFSFFLFLLGAIFIATIEIVPKEEKKNEV